MWSDRFSTYTKITSDGTAAPVVTDNYAISPEGYQNADRVTVTKPSGDQEYAIIRESKTVTKTAGDKFTQSVYLKATDASQVGKIVDIYAYDGSYLTVKNHALTSEWVRVEAIHTASIGTSNVEMVIGKARLFAGGTSVANMATDYLVYGHQFEAGSYPTSIIPTLGSTVTRLADSASKTLGTSYFPSTGFSVFIDFDVTGDTITNFADIFQITGGGTQFRLETRVNGSIYIQQLNMVTSGDNFNAYALCPTTAKKLCFTFSPTQVKAYVDGALVETFDGVYTFTPIDTLNLPIQTSSVSHKQTLLFGSVLTDAQAIELTTL